MDLHETLTESEFILPRLLGFDIQLTIHYDAEKSWILSAPTQIGQVLANLAINARDAMPEGGRLAISTRNATVLPEESADSPSISGDWVVLEDVRLCGKIPRSRTSGQFRLFAKTISVCISS